MPNYETGPTGEGRQTTGKSFKGGGEAPPERPAEGVVSPHRVAKEGAKPAHRRVRSPHVVSAMSTSDDEGEVRKRIPDAAIPRASDKDDSSQHKPLEAGDSVTGPSGAGKFVKYEDRPQGRYVVVQLGDMETRIPEERFAELYSRPDESSEGSEEGIGNLSARKNALRAALIEEITEVNGYDPDLLGLEYGSDRAKERVKELMDTARERHLLFHSDTRHPMLVKPADRDRGATVGIFKGGLVAAGDEEGNGVFTTPDSQMAMRYPELQEVPDGWDGKKYLYFIDPEGVIDNPDVLRKRIGAIRIDPDMSEDNRQLLYEVESGTIKPHRIAYCLEIENNHLLRIFTNKGYTADTPQQ